MTIILTIIILALCAWVSLPLFQADAAAKASPSGAAATQYKQNIAQGIQDDLLLDFQTGKISQEEYDELVAEVKDNAQPKKSSPQAGKFCSQCGAAVQKADKFCSACGSKLS